MKTITDYEIVDHGVEHEQYFEGCGLSFTEYDDTATGCGADYEEALSDALESLAQNDWDTESGEETVPENVGDPVGEDDHEEMYYYVSVRVK